MPDDMVLSEAEKWQLHSLLVREMRVLTGKDNHLFCSDRLLDLYNRADETGRHMINDTLAAVSGWSLPQLIDGMRRERRYSFGGAIGAESEHE